MSFRLANVAGRAALVHGDHYVDLATLAGGALGPDPMEAIANVDALHDLYQEAESAEPTGLLADAQLDAPVPRPRNSLAVGLNYQAHADEASMDTSSAPLLFAKFPSCIVGPNADVELRSEAADYEVELVVVIGTAGRDIASEAAWDHVAGLTGGQDISDRALQFAAKPPHFDMGKSRDTYGPLGPVLVSPDLMADRDAIRLTCDINGERRQDGSTADLIFAIPELIAYISAIMTLGPGDIIFTGTPEGIGATQGLFLKAGDVITSTIDGIGSFVNNCR